METYYHFDRDYTFDYTKKQKKDLGSFSKTKIEEEYENFKIDLFSSTKTIEHEQKESPKK